MVLLARLTEMIRCQYEMATSAASNGVMSLLQKFQDIAARINQSRAERASLAKFSESS